MCYDKGAEAKKIDVRDLADLHVLALTTPAAANKRFVTGFPNSNQRMADILKGFPEVRDRLAKDSNEVVVPAKLDTRPVQEALPINYRSVEETLHDTARRILELEKELGRD